MQKPSPILRENIPLAPLTTMGLGGPAHYLAECTCLDEMRDCLTWAAAEGLPVQDPNSRSVGSFFLNPVIDAEAFDALKDRYPNVPHFPDSADVKVPAAWLVEQAGFHKGLRRGDVGISERHALALVNRGGTTCEEIRDGVEQTFGIRLEREPVLVESGQ